MQVAEYHDESPAFGSQQRLELAPRRPRTARLELLEVVQDLIEVVVMAPRWRRMDLSVGERPESNRVTLAVSQ